MAIWKRTEDLSESDRHAKVSLEAVGVWTYLLGATDSCGRRSVDAEVLRRKVFTLRGGMTDEWIRARLAELASSGLIHPYPVDNPRYAVMHRYGKYNAGANLKVRPSYPPPPVGLCDSDCLIFHESESPPGGRNYAPLSPPSSSDSSGLESESDARAINNPTKLSADDEVMRMLMLRAEAAKCPNKPETVRSRLESLKARYGAQAVEKYLMDPANMGKDVNEWSDEFKARNGTHKSKSTVCKHGKSLMYGIQCRKCDEEKRHAPH